MKCICKKNRRISDSILLFSYENTVTEGANMRLFKACASWWTFSFIWTNELKSVFFHLFATPEPSANVYVAHGTLHNDSSVYPICSNKPVKQWYCFNRIELLLRILPRHWVTSSLPHAKR